MSTVHPSHANGKNCSKCNTFKPASAFSLRSDRAGKLKSWCNGCNNARSLALYYANHEEKKKYLRERAADRYHRDPESGRRRTASWRAKNPEASLAIGRRSEAKRREKKKVYRKANANRIKAKNAEYRHRKAAEIKAYNAEYYRLNKEVITSRIRKCNEAKPDLYFHLHKAAKHRRRVRLENQGPHEKFTDLEIFERDKWICQLCGKKVDKSLTYPDSGYPTLDHVVPVARGGGHTRANSQLAHLGCNSAKRDRLKTLF
jgi:5-methylcytosine-specific restriction endonuclease McrA